MDLTEQKYFPSFFKFPEQISATKATALLTKAVERGDKRTRRLQVRVLALRENPRRVRVRVLALLENPRRD